MVNYTGKSSHYSGRCGHIIQGGVLTLFREVWPHIIQGGVITLLTHTKVNDSVVKPGVLVN